MQMGSAFWTSRLVYTAARLRIADHLANGPKSAIEISASVGLNARALHRFMRALANFGILTHSDSVSFALTPLGDRLRSGVPGSVRSTILSLAGQWLWEAAKEFPYSVETGKPAMEKVHGKPFFDYLTQHPEEAAQFSEAMVGTYGEEPPAVAAAYDFSDMGVIVDIGGATGNMLAHILTRYPKPKGVLFDRPHVTTDAPALLRAHGVENRVLIENGDFFERVPVGGDAYILSHVIHDWDESRCQTILGNCRKAMKQSSKLLIVESVLPEGNTPHFGKLVDMVMLATTGGEERTAAEYRTLLTAASLTVTRVVPATANVSIVEAELA